MLADVAVVCPNCGTNVELTTAAALQSERLGVSCRCPDCQHEWICRSKEDERLLQNPVVGELDT